MKLSAPIYLLKSQAKDLKRSEKISLNEALDGIAQREGYQSWSLLFSKNKKHLPKTREEVLDYLNPSDLVLIGSRPGHGKTTFVLGLLIQALRNGKQCFFFTLESGRRDVAAKAAGLDTEIGERHPRFHFDFSDEISADYIIRGTADSIEPGALIAIDYLQLLDQQRSKPSLQNQVEALRAFAREKKCIVIFISQLDRAIENRRGALPSLADVRLPNPLDLSLINKSMFLVEGEVVALATSSAAP